MPEILSWTLSIIETTPDRWRHLAASLPDELFRAVPLPGQWSAMECLHHLYATELVLRYRLDVFLENGSEFPAYNPDAPENQPDPHIAPTELAVEFDRRRAASLAVLRQVSPDEMRRTAHHAELGPVTLEQMVHEWAAHDLNHTVQAERALMQPFFRGCGPWQKYFSDHILS